MVINKKTGAFIALFLVFIMIFSTVSTPYNQHFSDYSSMDAKDIKGNALGGDGQNRVISIDVKVQKIGDNIWADEINVSVGDIVNFKITVTNIGNYDLVDVEVIDQLPASDILEYMKGSSTINKEAKEPLFIDTERIFWKFAELPQGEEKIIIFSMVALKETTVEGAANYASVKASLNQKYVDEIHGLEEELTTTATRVQQIIYDIDAANGKLSTLNNELTSLIDNETSLKSEIDGIKEKIGGLQEVERGIKKTISDIDAEIAVLNSNKAGYEQDLINVQSQIDEKQIQLNDQINIVLGLKADLETHQQNLVVLNDTLNEYLNNQYDQNGTIATILHNIEVEEGIIATIKQDINSAENDLSVTNQTIVSLNNDANNLAISIATLNEQQTSLLNEKTILNDEHEKILSDVQSLENDLSDNYAKKLQIQNDITTKQNEKQSILTTLGTLSNKKDEIAAKILSIGENLKYYSDLKTDIEANITSNDAQLDQIILDIKAIEEKITINSAEILSNENTRQAQAKEISSSQEILSQYQADLLNLNNALNDALQANLQNNGTISYLLDQIKDYDEKIGLISSRINSLDEDINGTVVKINELKVSEQQYSDQLETLNVEKNARIGEKQVLQANYDKTVTDIQTLSNNIANENTVKIGIQNNLDQKLSLKQNVLGEIESLKQIADVISQEITSIKEKITEYNQLETYYKMQIDDNDSIINQLTLDISSKKNDYELNSKDISYYASLGATQKDDLASLQATLALQQENLATLYAKYDEALKTYNDRDGTITAIQTKIQSQLSLIEATKQDIKVAEELLSGTTETLTSLTYNQQQILDAIGLLDENIDKNILKRDETEVLILNQQDILNSLNGEILATKAQLTDVQNELFTNKLLFDSANAALNQLSLQKAALDENIATTTNSINTNTLEIDALEIQNGTLAAEIDTTTLYLNNQKTRQQEVNSEIAEKQQLKSDTEQYITSQQANLTLHRNTLDALYLDLDAALQSQQINNGTITTSQNLIAEQKDNIDQTQNSIALAEGELDAIIKDINNLENLRDQIALDITATSEQISIKTTEGDSLRIDYNNTVLNNEAKEQEKSGILSQIQNEQDDLFILTNNYDSKDLELQGIAADIGKNNSLLETIAQQEMQFVSDRNAENQNLSSIESELSSLLVNPIGHEIKINALQVEKRNTELKIVQISREIENCEYQLQETAVALDGLITSKNQVEQELTLIAGDIAAKEQLISDLESSKNDADAEILLLEQHKTLLNDQINANEADILSLQALKTSKEQEYNNHITQINDKNILKADKEKDIAQLNDLLATQQNKLADYYNDLNAAVLAQQDKNGGISAILGNIDLEKAAVASISDNILKAQSTLASITPILQSLTDEETLLSKQISDQEDILSSKILLKNDTEQQILEKESLTSSLLNDKAKYEADLTDIQGKIQTQQGVVSDLDAKISLLDYQEATLNDKILALEEQKTTEVSKKDVYEQLFSTIISDIDALSNKKMAKIDEYNVVHAQVLEKTDLKQTQESSLNSLEAQLADQQQTLDVYYNDLNAALQSQNSNDGSLKEIQDNINIQKEGIADTKQKITAAETTLNTTIQTLNDLTETGKQLQDSITALEEQKATAELEKLSSLLDYNNTIDQIKLLDADLSAKVNEQLQTQNSISDKQNLIPGIDADTEAINKQLSEANDLIISYEADLENNKQNKADLEASLIDKDATINQIILDINNAIDQQKIVSDEISKYESLKQTQDEELTSLQTTQNQYQESLATINSEYNSAMLAQTDIESKISSLRADINTAEGKVETKKADIAQAETALSITDQTLLTLRENEKQLQDTRTILEEQKTKNALDNETLVSQYNNADAEIETLNTDLSTSNADYEKTLSDISVYTNNLTAVENDLQKLDDTLLIVDAAITSNQKGIDDNKLLLEDNEAKITSNVAQLDQINSDINNSILKQQQIASDILASETVKKTQESNLNDLLTNLNQHKENRAKLNTDLQKELDAQQINNEYISDLLKQIKDTKTNIAQTADNVTAEESKQATISNEIDLLDSQKILTSQQIDTTTQSINDKQLVKTVYETDLQNIVDQKTDFENLQIKKENDLSSVQSQQMTAKQSIDEVTNTKNSLESEKIQLDQVITTISDLIKTKQDAISSLSLEDTDFAVVHISNLPVSSISIDKKAWDNDTGQWVDEITVELNENLRFNLTVKNTGDTDLYNIVIWDIFPAGLLGYSGNAYPREPEIVNNELYWNESYLPAGSSIFIEFDMKAISTGIAPNEAMVAASSGISAQYAKGDVKDKDALIVTVEKPENNPPVANDDYVTVTKGGTVTVLDSGDNSVLDNDTDPNGDALTATLISGPLHASSFTLNLDGTFSYTHDGSETTSDSFTYQASDGNGGNDTAIAEIDVKEGNTQNEPPTARDDYATVNEGGTVTILDSGDDSVLDNDTDPNGDTLKATKTSEPLHGNAAINNDGTFVYTHDGSETISDSFTYQASDGNGGNDTATVYVNIIPVNDYPVANDDTATVYYNSSNNVIDVLANDTDPDGDPLIIDSIVYPQPANGTVTVNETQESIIYTPNPGFIGEDYFEYVITDRNGGYASAKVTINVVKNISGIIVKPRGGYLYFRNYEALKITNLSRFMAADALIIGPINVKVEINDPDFVASKVEFYVDDVFKNTTLQSPYNWTFNEPPFFKICTIKAVAYGTIFGKESTISNEIDVLILNFGLFKSGTGDNSRSR